MSGMRVVVHAPGTLPNINEDGTNVRPGQATELRIRCASSSVAHRDSPRIRADKGTHVITFGSRRQFSQTVRDV